MNNNVSEISIIMLFWPKHYCYTILHHIVQMI